MFAPITRDRWAQNAQFDSTLSSSRNLRATRRLGYITVANRRYHKLAPSIRQNRDNECNRDYQQAGITEPHSSCFRFPITRHIYFHCNPSVDIVAFKRKV